MAANQTKPAGTEKNIGQIIHPDLDWEHAPQGSSGSIKQPKNWGDSADVFIEEKRNRTR